MEETDKALSTTIYEAKEAAEGILRAMEKFATEHGEDVADIILMGARIDAVSAIIPGFILLLISTLMLFTAKAVWKHRNEVKLADGGKTRSNETYLDSMAFVTIMLSCVGPIPGLFGLFGLFSVWAWAGVFYPELWIAAKLMGFVS